jgi:putative transposase
MRQSTRSAQRALKRLGSGGSIGLFSVVPVGVGKLPHAHKLSKGARQRLTWLDYRRTHTVKQTRLHFGIPRSTLNRRTKRFDPGNLANLEDRSSRPRTMRHRTWGTREVEAVLAVRAQYPRWGEAKLAVLLARQGIVLSRSMIGRILGYLRQRRLLIEPRPTRATPRARHARPHAQRKSKGVTIPRERPGDLVRIDTMRLYPLPGVVRYPSSAVDVVSRFGVVGVRGRRQRGRRRIPSRRCGHGLPSASRRSRSMAGVSSWRSSSRSARIRRFGCGCYHRHSPKLNGTVERMNRTFREEWWEGYAGEVDVVSMQGAGRAGEGMYNTIRPHQTLGMRTPVEFLVERFGIHP